MKRRNFLKGTVVLGLAGTSAANAVAAVGQTANGGAPLPDKIAAALARFRETIPPTSTPPMLRTPLFLSS